MPFRFVSCITGVSAGVAVDSKICFSFVSAKGLLFRSFSLSSRLGGRVNISVYNILAVTACCTWFV